MVVLDSKAPASFPARYFPRGFHYKKDADTLLKELEEKGGKGHVVPKSQFTTELIRRYWTKDK